MVAFSQLCGLLLGIHLLAFVQCQTGCTLQEFKESSLFDPHFDLSNLAQSYNLGASVRVPCQVGYRGFFKLICSDRGWMSQGDKCRIISCGHPGDVPFADFKLVKGTDYVFGSQVIYVCQKGYQMTSYSNKMTCLQEGWDGRLPECEPISCPPLMVDNNVLVYGDMDQPASGSVLQFSCSSRDDEVIGATQIICDENGNWDSKPPTCREILCVKPPLENFEVEGVKTVYKKDEVLTYSCNPGYRKMDGRRSECIKVGQSSQWVPTPRCEPITCKLSSDPPEGTTYSPRNKIIFRVGEKVTIQCEEKHWVRSTEYKSDELTCLDTGDWDSEAVCKPVECLKHAENVYRWERTWYNSVSEGTTLWYRCHDGYEETSPGATCTRRGWHPRQLCIAKGCTKPQHKNAEITDNEKNEYKHNEEVSFRCIYDHEVTFEVQCDRGKWKDSYQNCKERPCTTQPHVENGDMRGEKRAEYAHGDKVLFRCKADTRDFKVTCDRGEWKKDKSCADVPCTTQPDIRNGLMTDPKKSQYRHDETVKMKCTTGSEETFTVSCQSGTWIPTLNCPEQSLCGNTAVSNGYSYEHQNLLYYACNHGHRPITEGWWGQASCENGKWKTAECIAVTDCGPLPEVPNMNTRSKILKFSDGHAFPIQCDTGYQNLHTALSDLICTNGTWTANSVSWKDICTPIARMCKPPPEIKNAVITFPFEKEYLSETTLTYKCRNKFILEGHATIQCIDGNWEQKNISCKAPSSCGRPPFIEHGGLYLPDTELINNTKILYKCESTYEMQGGPYKTCINGEWIGEISCLSTCNVGSIPNSVLVNPQNAQYLLKGQSLQFRCRDKSLFLRGQKQVTCLENGQWNHPFPLCTDRHHCGPPPALANGDFFASTSEFINIMQVLYQCQSKYIMQGGPHKTCLDGEWVGEITCLKPCTVNPDLMAPNKIRFRYNSRDKLYAEHNEPITFTCIRGATHDGNAELRQICNNGEIVIPRCV